MKVLLASIGSRGDVQPILALACELRSLGHEASLCVAPNFKDWVESFGVACVPIGPDLRKLTGGSAPAKPVKPTPEQLRQLAVGTVRTQFQVLADAARGCDLIVAAGALQIAARSIAEAVRIPYLFTAYCPAILPAPGHPPPKMGSHFSHSLPAMVNRFLWRRDRRSWDVLFLETVNEERAKLGLAPIEGIQRHIFTDSPWLASDAALAPAAATSSMRIVQTGAWLLPDKTRLPELLESFLANGEPPVYFGFGSMRAADQTGRMLVEAARTLGLRAVISQGWANLSLLDDGTDCILAGDINHERLFPRVAAVVHHGGAGTTTAAARAGKSQVIVPHLYDQYYWAHRVKKLSVGVSSHSGERLIVGAMVAALREALRPEKTARAQTLANRIELNGTQIAAQRMVREFS